MALTGWSTSNLLRIVGAVPSALPFFVHAWGNTATGDATFRTIFSLDDGVNGGTRQSLRATDTDQVECDTGGTGGPSGAIATGTHPNNTWFSMSGAWISTASRSAWRNGSNRGNDTGSATTNTLTGTKIGVWRDAFPWASAGGIAEVSVWDATGFTSGNLDSLASKLAAGGNPINIRNEAGQPWTAKLLGYWIDSANTITDLSGNGNNMTMLGTLTNFGSHPTIDAVITGSAVPLMMMNRRRRYS